MEKKKKQECESEGGGNVWMNCNEIQKFGVGLRIKEEEDEVRSGNVFTPV